MPEYFLFFFFSFMFMFGDREHGGMEFWVGIGMHHRRQLDGIMLFMLLFFLFFPSLRFISLSLSVSLGISYTFPLLPK